MTSRVPAGPAKWSPLVHQPAKRGWVSLREVLPSLPVYRYMRLAQFEELVTQRRLRLVPPQAWDDPHERWWCDSLFRANSRLANANAYASCWTTRYLDEPFWRLYACWCGPGTPHPKPAVRVRTTVGRLEQATRLAIQDSPAKVFIGRVRYCSRDELGRASVALRKGEGKDVASEVANGLHMKRNAFAFEREVRVLWVDKQPRRCDTQVPVDPLSFIDQVMVGPTNHKDLLADVTDRVKMLGFKAKESSIYTPPIR